MNRIFKALILNDYPGKPYAQQVKEGTKLIETRMNKLFTYRGDIVICCGASNSISDNAGKALCIVNIWKGRAMLKSDEIAACIEWHPKRKSLLLKDWRHFDEDFEFAPCAIEKNFQGMFSIQIPDHIKIIPRPDIIPFSETELQSSLF